MLYVAPLFAFDCHEISFYDELLAGMETWMHTCNALRKFKMVKVLTAL